MTDAALYHEELLDLEQQVEVILSSMGAARQPGPSSSPAAPAGSGGGGAPSSSSSARAATFSKAQDHLRRMNRLLQQLRVEVRLLDGAERDVYEAHAGAHAKTVASLRERVQQCKERAAQSTAAAVAAAVSSSQPNAGFHPVEGGAGVVWSPREGGDGDDGADGGDGPVMANRAEARQAASRIHDVQHNTLQSLGRSEKLLNETETLGTEAATTLRAQTEQIKQTNQELDEMHSEIGRASTELKSFMRRMARDRLIIFFLIAIVVCIIIIVILAVLKHKWH